jgi:hypothetical protein
MISTQLTSGFIWYYFVTTYMLTCDCTSLPIYFDRFRVWDLRVAASAVDDSLVMPLLHVSRVNFPFARRLQCLQFSILVHSFTTILCIWKDNHTTMVRYFGPIVFLAVSIGQLGFLLWHYPIVEV